MYLGEPAPWSLGLASTSSTLRLGVERHRQPSAGDVETPSFLEKLLSGKRDQGDRELGVSLGGLAFVASQGAPRKRLGGREAILLIECFNNVD